MPENMSPQVCHALLFELLPSLLHPPAPPRKGFVPMVSVDKLPEDIFTSSLPACPLGKNIAFKKSAAILQTHTWSQLMALVFDMEFTDIPQNMDDDIVKFGKPAQMLMNTACQRPHNQ